MPLRMRSRPDGQQQSERQRQQAADANDERRLREDVLDDAHAREAERAKRRDFAEPLIDRDRQQHGDEQHGKRHRHRGQDARDLSKVGEARLLKASDDLAVGRGPDLGMLRADGRRRAVGIARRCDEDQIRLVADVSAAGRLERVERTASGALVRRLKRELRDAHDLQARRPAALRDRRRTTRAS